MGYSPFRLLVGLTLIVLIVAPSVVNAQTLTKVYADSACAVGTPGRDGTRNSPVCVGSSPPDFTPAVKLLKDGVGTIYYIYAGGWCEFSVQSGRDPDFVKCETSPVPKDGAPIAPTLLWGLGSVAAIALLIAGIFLRRRGSAPR